MASTHQGVCDGGAVAADVAASKEQLATLPNVGLRPLPGRPAPAPKACVRSLGDGLTLTRPAASPRSAYYVEAPDLVGSALVQASSRASPLPALGLHGLSTTARKSAPLYRDCRAGWVSAGVLAPVGVVLAVEVERNPRTLAAALSHRASHTRVQAQSEDLQRSRLYPLMLSAFGCAGALKIADAMFWAS